MTATIAECAENARRCKWYASKTKSVEERRFLLMAKRWRDLAAEKEREIRVLLGPPRSRSASMSDAQQMRDRATCLYAMALKARDNNINDYAGHLEELAAEASAHADRLSGKVQQ